MGRDAGDRRRQLGPWHETVERLTFLLVPLACILALCSREVIVTLYKEQYAASAPIFTITAIGIALAALPTDSVLRAYAETRFLFVLSFLKLIFIATTIAWFVRRFGLPGAVMVTIIATAGAKVAAVWRVAALLEVPTRRVLPWRRVIGATAAALVALVPAAIARHHLHLSAPLVALVVGSIYALTYGGMVGLWWSLRRVVVWPAPTLSNADRP
jgi:O-antigen/teichoic acid export membrane protein